MANDKDLARIRQGVAVWNEWRAQNPECRVNLAGAELSVAQLAGANLRAADLSAANFYGADLRLADLSAANLTKANLGEANLRLADLHLADLSFVELVETVFVDVNLSTTKGLETCMHHGPSVLDHRTMQRSGRLPLAFLRGCGLPDRLIDYLPSLLGQAIQYHSCFISYSSKDEAFAKRLHADLQNNGVRCWFAPEDMKIGDKFRQRIDEAIHVNERLLLILSENSVSSEWVEKEVETAFEKEQRQKPRTVLYPVRLDNAVMDSHTGWCPPTAARRSRWHWSVNQDETIIAGFVT
jgi:TIR domain/Pentapeptide repeats (8 copies)